MKLATAFYAAALAFASGVALADEIPTPPGELPPNNPPNQTTFTFPLEVSPGAKACLPDAEGTVIAHTFGNVENLQVVVHNMPPNTDFVLFIIQVPNGAVWARLV